MNDKDKPLGIKIGDVVRTSYSSFVYIVTDIKQFLGGGQPFYQLTCRRPDDRRGVRPCYLTVRRWNGKYVNRGHGEITLVGPDDEAFPEQGIQLSLFDGGPDHAR